MTCDATTTPDCANARLAKLRAFKNQGDCVSFVATGGRNPPATR